MKYCTKCGKEVTEGLKFCTNCGAPVQPGAHPPMDKQGAPHSNQQGKPRMGQQGRPQMNHQGRPQMGPRPQMNKPRRPQRDPRTNRPGYGYDEPPKNNNKKIIAIMSAILGIVVIVCVVVVVIFATKDSDSETANSNNNTPQTQQVVPTQANQPTTNFEVTTSMEPQTESPTQRPTQRPTPKPTKKKTHKKPSGNKNYRVAPDEYISDDYYYETYYGLSENDALIATILGINEYYARKGCCFDAGGLQKYFNNQSWYSNNGKKAKKSMLTGMAYDNAEQLDKDRNYYRNSLGVKGLAKNYTYSDFVRVAKKIY